MEMKNAQRFLRPVLTTYDRMTPNSRQQQFDLSNSRNFANNSGMNSHQRVDIDSNVQLLLNPIQSYEEKLAEYRSEPYLNQEPGVNSVRVKE